GFSGLLALATGALLVHVGRSVRRATFPSASRSRVTHLQFLAITTCLHLIQPLARLVGRLRCDLPAFWHTTKEFAFPWPRTITIWCERSRSAVDHVSDLETTLRLNGVGASHGGVYDRWDLEIPGGLFGAVRLRSAVEDHGSGKQLARWQTWPHCPAYWLLLSALFVGLGGGAARDHALGASAAVRLGGCPSRPRMGAACRAATAGAVASLTSADSEADVPPRPPDRSEGSMTYFRRVLPYARPYWRFGLISALVTILMSLAGLAAPWPLK